MIWHITYVKSRWTISLIGINVTGLTAYRLHITVTKLKLKFKYMLLNYDKCLLKSVQAIQADRCAQCEGPGLLSGRPKTNIDDPYGLGSFPFDKLQVIFGNQLFFIRL